MNGPFDDVWDILHIDKEINAIAREQEKKQMGKATFWLVAAVAVIFLLGKISTLNQGA